jgi:peroxiredoxin
VACEIELLQLQPVMESYREKGLALLIAAAASSAEMRGVLERCRLKATVLDDRSGALTRQFAVQAFPSGLLFDRAGILVDVSEGWRRESSLQEWKRKVEEVL